MFTQSQDPTENPMWTPDTYCKLINSVGIKISQHEACRNTGLELGSLTIKTYVSEFNVNSKMECVNEFMNPDQLALMNFPQGMSYNGWFVVPLGTDINIYKMKYNQGGLCGDPDEGGSTSGTGSSNEFGTVVQQSTNVTMPTYTSFCDCEDIDKTDKFGPDKLKETTVVRDKLLPLPHTTRQGWGRNWKSIVLKVLEKHKTEINNLLEDGDKYGVYNSFTEDCNKVAPREVFGRFNVHPDLISSPALDPAQMLAWLISMYNDLLDKLLDSNYVDLNISRERYEELMAELIAQRDEAIARLRSLYHTDLRKLNIGGHFPDKANDSYADDAYNYYDMYSASPYKIENRSCFEDFTWESVRRGATYDGHCPEC